MISNFKIPSIDTPIFSTTIEVRIQNINYGNHLGHDSLVSLLHEARVRFFRKIGYTELDIGGCGVMMKSLLINYMNQAFYSDQLSISLGVGEVSKVSFELVYQVMNHEKNKEIARAITLMVCYDARENKVVKIPQV